MNKVFLIGRLVRKPELTALVTGTAAIQGSIAVNRPFKNKEGEFEADFINFVAFGAYAELINKYFDKGDRIGLFGRWQTRSYTNKENQRIYVNEMVVENIEFLQDKKATAPAPYSNSKFENAPAVQQQPSEMKKNIQDDFKATYEITDDDLPF